MATKAADALIMAYRRRVPCQFGFARTEEHEIAFNRRYFMKDGTVRTWPGIGNPDAVRPAAGVDPELDVIRVDDLDGKPIAVITNFANHLDLIGGTKYSADYPGVLSKELKKRLDCDSVVSLFLNGCCGDVTHIDYTGKHKFDDKHYIKCGKILADDVMSVYDGIEMTRDADIDYIFDTKYIDRRQVSEDDYLENKEALLRYERDKKAAKAASAESADGYENPATGDGMAMSYVKCTVALFEHPLPHELVYLQGVKLGDIYFAGMPGEMFAELGLDLKARSPFDKTVCVELANGCFGYIATKKAFAEGGYEVSLDRYVNMSEDAGDIINDVLIDIAEKLK
ncbi:MAG: hypothetical protein IJT91_04025 [Clostridia bacterium]|nr:hypothetical protein [Clostridia bacterium]